MRILKSLTEITDIVLQIFNGGKLSDQYGLSKRTVKYLIYDWRATLIRRDEDENKFLSDSLWQWLNGAVPLVLVEASEVGLDTGDYVLRTVNPLPAPIRSKKRDIIEFYRVDSKTRIQPIRMGEQNYFGFSKYTGKAIRSLYLNGYGYIFGTKMLRDIKVRVVAENPKVAANYFPNIGGADFDDNSPFPMPLDMITQMRQAILSGDLKMSKEMPIDTDDDGLPVNTIKER